MVKVREISENDNKIISSLLEKKPKGEGNEYEAITLASN